jgi:hypothetical protein
MGAWEPERREHGGLARRTWLLDYPAKARVVKLESWPDTRISCQPEPIGKAVRSGPENRLRSAASANA